VTRHARAVSSLMLEAEKQQESVTNDRVLVTV
jgi:hypothetical protein